jgi:hypothetical protein
VDRRGAEVARLRARLRGDLRVLADAQDELLIVRAVRAVAHDAERAAHQRRESAWTLAVVLAICTAVDLMAVRATLPVVLPPSRLASVVALSLAAAQTAAALAAGRLVHRVHSAADLRRSAAERTLLGALVGAVAAVIVATGLVLGATGGVGLGLVTVAGGATAALLAALASYLHQCTVAGLPGGAALRLRFRAGRAFRTDRRLRRACVRQRVAAGELRAAATAAVADVDLVYAEAQFGPAGGEPLWVRRMRRWARGENLPGEAA